METYQAGPNLETGVRLYTGSKMRCCTWCVRRLRLKLQAALENDSVKGLEKVIRFGYDPSLVVVAQHGAVCCLQYLIQHGADVNSKDHLGYRAAHGAVASGRAHVLDILIRADARVDELLPDDISLLELAARNNKHKDPTGHERCVALLLAVDILWPRRSFERAIEFGTAETARLFLEAGYQPPKKISSAGNPMNAYVLTHCVRHFEPSLAAVFAAVHPGYRKLLVSLRTLFLTTILPEDLFWEILGYRWGIWHPTTEPGCKAQHAHALYPFVPSVCDGSQAAF